MTSKIRGIILIFSDFVQMNRLLRLQRLFAFAHDGFYILHITAFTFTDTFHI